jgi:hypothetical protein
MTGTDLATPEHWPDKAVTVATAAGCPEPPDSIGGLAGGMEGPGGWWGGWRGQAGQLGCDAGLEQWRPTGGADAVAAEAPAAMQRETRKGCALPDSESAGPAPPKPGWAVQRAAGTGVPSESPIATASRRDRVRFLTRARA